MASRGRVGAPGVSRFRLPGGSGGWLFFSTLALLACGSEESIPKTAEPLDSVETTVETRTSLGVSTAEYTTSAACRDCHESEFQAWTGSHHDRAMEIATEETVLGNFDDVSFEWNGESWRFFRRDGGFWANAVGPNGVRADFEIRHTFGVDPLQQYLVALPNGQYQAMTVAWDTRPAAVGGQRWFSLYPDEVLTPNDVLHWTGDANRWNSMCAHCHSTNLRKNFDPAGPSYDTRYSEIDVACEACHGPASLHVEWAKAGGDPAKGRGFAEASGSDADARWAMNPETGIATRVPPLSDDTGIEACSGCHSRRSLISEETADPLFLDRHVPALLEEGLYFPDGQIQDEVYVYGSFIQSRMYAAGVRCGDCHEPHSLALREAGNALCAQCHAPSVFAVRSHHQHAEGSIGAQCVDCHMPARTYMVVDDRRDHSFRIPRPDLSAELGVPNACNGCHTDRDASWAARAIAGWPNAKSAQREHYGEALRAGRIGAADAQGKLLELARDPGFPAIARASAVSLLSGFPGAALPDGVRRAAADAQPLVRMAAARAAGSLSPNERVAVVGELLHDPVRAVRIEAAFTLAAADPARLFGAEARALGPALAEYRHSQELQADRPNSHVNLALLASSMGRLDEAETHYRQALEVGPYFVPGYANLADLLRRQQREAEAEKVLAQGLEVDSESAELHHALGLLFVRTGRPELARKELRRSHLLAPENARYGYVLGVAIYSSGDAEAALETLRAAHERHPADQDLLEALVSISREAGRLDESDAYMKKLQALTQTGLGHASP